MEINEHVNRIKNYFINLSLSEGAICVIVKLPKDWSIGDEKDLEAQFKCKVVPQQQNCYFFVTEMENGFDIVFDCIEYVINTNKAIEEKYALLKIKANELTELFANEPLDRLKTLYFAFEEPETGKKKNKKKISKPVQEEIVEEPEEVSEPQEKDVVKEVKETPIEQTSSILALAQEMVR